MYTNLDNMSVFKVIYINVFHLYWNVKIPHIQYFRFAGGSNHSQHFLRLTFLVRYFSVQSWYLPVIVNFKQVSYNGKYNVCLLFFLSSQCFLWSFMKDFQSFHFMLFDKQREGNSLWLKVYALRRVLDTRRFLNKYRPTLRGEGFMFS